MPDAGSNDAAGGSCDVAAQSRKAVPFPFRPLSATEKWPQKAAEIYETVIRLLSEEDE